MLISIIGVIASLLNIGKILYSYNKSKSKYKLLREFVKEDSVDINKDNNGNGNRANYNKFIQLKNINSDCIGWIKIDDTNIDYPVVKGTDNKFYLSHNFYKEMDKVGCIFMDYQNSGVELDKNIILYGHNMNDKSMFASLNNYLDDEFYNKHKFVVFEFLGIKYEYEIFSVYTTTEYDWMRINFSEENMFNQYLTIINKKSVINNNKQYSNKDKILTLSSCTNRVNNERVVVHAILKSVGGN